MSRFLRYQRSITVMLFAVGLLLCVWASSGCTVLEGPGIKLEVGPSANAPAVPEAPADLSPAELDEALESLPPEALELPEPAPHEAPVVLPESNFMIAANKTIHALDDIQEKLKAIPIAIAKTDDILTAIEAAGLKIPSGPAAKIEAGADALQERLAAAKAKAKQFEEVPLVSNLAKGIIGIFTIGQTIAYGVAALARKRTKAAREERDSMVATANELDNALSATMGALDTVKAKVKAKVEIGSVGALVREEAGKRGVAPAVHEAYAAMKGEIAEAVA